MRTGIWVQPARRGSAPWASVPLHSSPPPPPVRQTGSQALCQRLVPDQAPCFSCPSVSFPLHLGTFLLFKVFCKIFFSLFFPFLFFFYKLICFQFHLVDASVFSYLWLLGSGQTGLGAAFLESLPGHLPQAGRCQSLATRGQGQPGLYCSSSDSHLL